MKISQLLNLSRKELQPISSIPYREGTWILSKILKMKNPGDLYLKYDQDISKENELLFLNTIKKRKEGWPLDYLLKEKFFMGEKFFIQDGVFIPRMDSEILVSSGLEKNKSQLRGIDFGAGVGTLCLSFLQKSIESRFVAVEISSRSIECLLKNSHHKKVQNRLKILQKDVAHLNSDDFLNFLNGPPDIIVANPPYVEASDEELALETLHFEPPIALFSDEKGMGHIYSWFKKSMKFLITDGIYIFEFGYDQSHRVKQFLQERKEIKNYQIRQDDQGIDRIAICVKR